MHTQVSTWQLQAPTSFMAEERSRRARTSEASTQRSKARSLLSRLQGGSSKDSSPVSDEEKIAAHDRDRVCVKIHCWDYWHQFLSGQVMIRVMLTCTDDAQHDAGRHPVADFKHKLAECKAAVADTVYAEAQHEVRYRSASLDGMPWLVIVVMFRMVPTRVSGLAPE